MYEDKTLTCNDCGETFTFTAGEQEFYAEKGFTNEPLRCKTCRDKRKANRARKEMFPIICDGCGKEAQVPFKPTEGRPVYCKDCFANKK